MWNCLFTSLNFLENKQVLSAQLIFFSLNTFILRSKWNMCVYIYIHIIYLYVYTHTHIWTHSYSLDSNHFNSLNLPCSHWHLVCFSNPYNTGNNVIGNNDTDLPLPLKGEVRWCCTGSFMLSMFLFYGGPSSSQIPNRKWLFLPKQVSHSTSVTTAHENAAHVRKSSDAWGKSVTTTEC